MKIVIYYANSVFESGGIGNWIYEVATRLSQNNEVTLVGSSKSSFQMQSNQRIHKMLKGDLKHFEFLPLKFPIGVAIPSPLYLRKIVKIMNSSDVVYFILPSNPNEALFYLLKKFIRTKILAGFHGQVESEEVSRKVYLPIFKHALKIFEAYHVLNKQTKNWLKELGFNNIYCIPNGVDTNVFRYRGTQKNPEFRVLYVGWLWKAKGIQTLLTLADRLKKIDANIKIVICGSGELEYLVKDSSVKNQNIEYLGYILPETIREVYESSNLFLLPSKMEGMPLSILEAQSCGLPIVASKIPGIIELSVNGKAIKLLDVDDIEGFLHEILYYYRLWQNSPEKYEKCRISIREYAMVNSDWTLIVNRIEQMFANITKSN